MPLIYSFVARGTTVLGEATQGNYEGNFRSVALQFLERCPTDTDKFVYPCEDLTFNFLVDQGFSFLVVADKQEGREMPYACLDSLRGEFQAVCGPQAQTAKSMSMQKTLGPLLLSKMQYTMDHPEEASATRGLQRQVREVQQVMEQNILQVLQRGERIESIGEKTERLQAGAQQFKQHGTELRKKMYWQNKKWWAILIIVIILIVVVIFLSICFGGGHNCFNN